MSRFYAAAQSQPRKKVFLEEGAQNFTYGELVDQLGRLTAYLAASGLKPGERVVISAADPRHTAVLFFGLIDSGLVPVIAAPDLRPSEFRLVATVAGVAGCIMDAATLDNCLPQAHELRLVLPIRAQKAKKNLVNKLLGGGSRAAAPADSYPAVLDTCEPTAPGQLWHDDHEAYVIMTSGSTSAPKAVSIHHGALFAHLATLGRQFGYSADSRLFNILPLYHVDGLIQGPAVASLHGACWIRPFSFSIPNIEPLLLSLYRLRASHLVAVPTILSLILRLGREFADSFDYEEFRFVVSAAGHLEARLWEDFQSAFGVRVANLYGLTETVTGALFSGPGNDCYRIGSIGKPVDCEARIVGEDGAEVAQGEIGELVLRGANVFRGYLGLDAVNAELFLDGWLRTGDLAHVDANGLYYIDGRLKNVVIYGGENIYPEEVTEVLNQHPAVIEAHCFGVDYPEWGEILVAAVVPGEGFDEAAVTGWLEERLTHFKVPRKWLQVDALPKGPSGKVLVPELRELYQAGGAAQAAVAGGNVQERIFAIAARAFRVSTSELSASSSPESTRGWDSLAHVEFMLQLEGEFEIRLSATDIAVITSLGAAESRVSARLQH
ncbi:hypothetical protein E4634_13555 [Mangrovimicrobium sediminis]|uniref:Carrier domain-containing protein n=1 Tax=Mangrovimicrobium sediminis TaxID=2562682 RepID=A0A4Z0LZ48_9GAMM|nr:AMP-binding protein [Haliea sp. SAOS-164]TGD72549.1 hypothetical protein E4634_13555 [Haliea sp. SAOS-164]